MTDATPFTEPPGGAEKALEDLRLAILSLAPVSDLTSPRFSDRLMVSRGDVMDLFILVDEVAAQVAALRSGSAAPGTGGEG